LAGYARYGVYKIAKSKEQGAKEEEDCILLCSLLLAICSLILPSYLIGTSPKVIEEGFTAGSVLACYLAADGYRLNTPLFKMKVKVPGEYDGSETHLPHGVYPTVAPSATLPT